MSKWKNFQSIRVPPSLAGITRPRFSLTSDILSFRHCSYQYGHFGNDGFVPAQAAQIFFGTAIHQVLDHCHRHYWGLYDGISKGTLPQDADIEEYFVQVENALKSHGIRPANAAVRDRALVVLKAFNSVEGKTLYPCIHDTEFRLESDRSQYVLRGVVDVLVNDGEDPENPEKREIWDYKGAENPGLSHQDMQDYEWQMCVYAELYKAKSGVY
uniref:PD-(D/E)XK nuclease family protein n=1 Tax=Herbaspirillum rhizosphaerae TaxID=346179 RepID=UPI000AD3D36B